MNADPLSDQISAAAAEAGRHVGRPGDAHVEQHIPTDHAPPAIARLIEGYQAATLACQHINASPRPEYWTPSVPETVFCRECAPAAMAEAARRCIADGTAGLPASCDTCGARGRDGARVEIACGPGVISAWLCNDCHPEGADAPRTDGRPVQ